MNTTLRTIRTRTLNQRSTTCRATPHSRSYCSRAPSSRTCASLFESFRYAPHREHAKCLHTNLTLDSANRRQVLLSQCPFENRRRIHSTPRRQNQRKGNASAEPEPEPDFDPEAPLDWRKWSSRTTATVLLGVGGSLYYVTQ